MPRLKRIPRQPQADQTLEIVLTDIETAGRFSARLLSYEIRDKEILLLYTQEPALAREGQGEQAASCEGT